MNVKFHIHFLWSIKRNLKCCDGSRWIVAQQHPLRATIASVEDEDIPGRSPSYTDMNKDAFGCEHYKRNCKVRAVCCGILFPCRFCHDEVSDHTMDR
jgi:zinc finger-like protein